MKPISFQAIQKRCPIFQRLHLEKKRSFGPRWFLSFQTAGSLDFFSRGHPRAVLVDAEPKVVERMVERSQRPGDVKQFRVGLGGIQVAMPGCFVWGAEFLEISLGE